MMATRFRPASWRLKYRIFSGFLLIGLVSCGVALMLAFTVNDVYSRFQNFTSFSQRVELGLDLSGRMVELQRLSGEFVNDGQALAADQASLVLSQAKQLLGELESTTGDRFGSRARIMNEHLSGFEQAFVEVRKQRERQSELVTDTITERALRYRQLLAEYEAGIGSEQTDWVARLERLRNSALQIERHMRNYFDRLDNALIREINSEVRYSRELIRELPVRREGIGNPGLVGQMDEALRSYQAAIVEAVQLTRGFLYLVNVVMAAETHEITYQAERLAEGLRNEMGRIETEMARSIRRAIWSALIGTFVTLCLILLLSWRLGQGIAGPIEQLTQGFRRLARGELAGDADLSGAGYEFRELSHAAQVFREKNEETRRLLVQYRELSEELEHRVNERTRELEQANLQLEKLSRTDELTRLANRRSFDEVLAVEWAVAQRSGLKLAMLMMDIDYFKPYNDHYGHLAGDDCLRQVAGTLEACMRRRTDLVARYGGEEFVAVLQDTDDQGALAMAETLRLAVRNLCITHQYSHLGIVSVSVGAAVATPATRPGEPSELIRLADQALYLAKQTGRDRACLLPFRPSSGTYRMATG